jgi:hypothetical protein
MQPTHKLAKWQRGLAARGVDLEAWRDSRQGWPSAWAAQRSLYPIVEAAWKLSPYGGVQHSHEALSYQLVWVGFHHLGPNVSTQEFELWREILKAPRPLSPNQRTAYAADTRRAPPGAIGQEGVHFFVTEALFLLLAPTTWVYAFDVVAALKGAAGFHEPHFCATLLSLYPTPRIP